MLSHIGADQRHEGSSEKSQLGTANRLHCTLYPSWARFSGSRTNFIRARTTSRHGPSTGEILVRHGWGKVVCTTKSIRAEPIFLVRVLFSSEPCKNFLPCKWGLKLLSKTSYFASSLYPPFNLTPNAHEGEKYPSLTILFVLQILNS